MILFCKVKMILMLHQIVKKYLKIILKVENKDLRNCLKAQITKRNFGISINLKMKILKKA